MAVCPATADPVLSHLLDELVCGQLDAEAGDGLELVERPARMAEAPTAHLPEWNAACGDHRSNRDRDLVPDAARRVLVDDAAPESTREVNRLAARHHRIGQGKGLEPGSDRGTRQP